MKKRVYLKNPNRKRLVNEALEAVRETRESLDPALLEKARDAIGTAIESYQSDRYRSIQADKVPVDQKKNLSIVMKYLELNPDNKALHKEIQSFLTQH